MPDFYLFGGPNGAGKTTAALQILPALGCEKFVNADLIIIGLSPLNDDAIAWKYERGLVNFRETYLPRADFCTVLDNSGNGYLLAGRSMGSKSEVLLPDIWEAVTNG